ncbi:MAG: choice-of-anchor N protein [Candidatus Brocadiae bacterium]|nr:choice-of-anchor N protein [Candidatus Brocadiia bacterium]
MRFRSACIIAIMLAWVSSAALGVPTLQLFPPDGVYNTETESWETIGSPFELWVVGAKTPDLVHRIEQVTLFIAVPNSVWDPSATVTVTTITDNPLDNNPLAPASLTLTKDDLATGDQPSTPDELSYFQNFPDHGIYPARFWAVDLSQFLYPDTSPSFLDVENAGETVMDYIPGGTGVDQGDIQYFEISFSPINFFFALHFDLIGFATNTWTKWKFAPFSHDADAGGIPEPTTAVLLAVGVVGLAARRFRRRRR